MYAVYNAEWWDHAARLGTDFDDDLARHYIDTLETVILHRVREGSWAIYTRLAYCEIPDDPVSLTVAAERLGWDPATLINWRADRDILRTEISGPLFYGLARVFGIDLSSLEYPNDTLAFRAGVCLAIPSFCTARDKRLDKRSRANPVGFKAGILLEEVMNDGALLKEWLRIISCFGPNESLEQEASRSGSGLCAFLTHLTASANSILCQASEYRLGRLDPGDLRMTLDHLLAGWNRYQAEWCIVRRLAATCFPELPIHPIILQ